ncbi:protein TILLER ANGLE CONTROL 1 [Henckelia pumila]|uniref:protein TILLER ANGLE CONTROL 1 n=1 Tax=Henckelia pumila TaxID=405737 RepID=UPI003C6E6F89
MKIFNWVHRKLKDGSAAQNAKKNGVISDEGGDANQFLVDNNTFGDSVFGCWKGGILTIGTFGYDPLTKDFAEVDDEQDYHHDHVHDQDQEFEEVESAAENEETMTDSEEEEVLEDDEDEEEESNPLVYAVYAHDYKALLQQYDPAADYIKMNGNKDFEHVMMMMEENDRDVDMKKDRITLADLFSADNWDADYDDQKKQSKKKLHELMEEKASSKKHGRLAFAKKLLLAGDSKDARPIHKLHRLVRRMLKRKIHPELGLVNKLEVNESNIPKANESVPLLPVTQDGNGV